ncbi:MAG TPA: MFS transporter [Candidatus Binatia bacterium]|nr:MFS transporter [Candidatus Binatia bacterium]
MTEGNTTLIASLKTLPRAAWILFLGTFLNKFGTFVIPFFALYLTRQGYSMSEAGFALGAYGAGHLLASAVGGQLADRIGRRSTIVVSMVSAAICMMLLSQARTYPVLLALATLTGLASELYRPASSALLADLVSDQHRITAYSTYRLALNAGWAFGPATAGFVAEKSFFWLFAGDAASSLLFGIVAWLFLPHGVRTARTEAGWSFALRSIRANPEFLRCLIASVAIALVMYQMTATFGLHVTASGLSSATYGVLISLNGLLVVLFELPLTTVTRRLSPRRTLAAGYLLIGFGFALNAWARTLPALVGCILIFTLGEMIAMPVSAAYMASLAPPDMRGRYMGAYGFSWALALIFGPAVGVPLFSHNPQILWIVCGGLGVLAAIVISLTATPRTVPVPVGTADG